MENAEEGWADIAQKTNYRRRLGDGDSRSIIVKSACEFVERCLDIDWAKVDGEGMVRIPPNFTWAASADMIDPRNVVDALKRLGGGDVQLDTSNINRCNYTQARFVMSKSAFDAVREKISEYRNNELGDNSFYFTR